MRRYIRLVALALLTVFSTFLAVVPASASIWVPDASNSVTGTWQTGGVSLKYYSTTSDELLITMSAPKKQGYTTSMPMAHTATWGGATTLTTAYTPNAPVVASNGIGIKYLSTQLSTAQKTAAATAPVAFDTITFTFSKPVLDPVFHVNNLGGFNGGSMYSQYRILGGNTMNLLSSQGNFMVESGTTIKVINVPLASTTSSTGTGSGSVQIPGVFTSISFELGLSCSSAAACGGTIPEGVAFQWSLPSVYTAPPLVAKASDDYATTDPRTAVDLDMLANDTFGDGLLSGSPRLCATGETGATCSVTSSTTTVDGTWELLNPSPGVTYARFTPANTFTGNTSLPYMFKDLNNEVLSATLYVTVNEPPAISALDDSAATVGVTPVDLDILDNDTVGLGVASGTVKMCEGSDTGIACAATTALTADGSWSLDAGTNIVTFTPANGFVGHTSLPYVFQDDFGQIATATMTVTVSAGPATAADDNDSTTPDTPVSIDILDNDYLGDGLAPGTLRLCSEGQTAGACSVTSSVTTIEGTWDLDSDAHTVTFTPAPGFLGVATLPYVFEDTNSNLVSAVISVTVAAPVDPLDGSSGESALPNTGLESGLIGTWGVTAVAMGAAGLWFRRRTRT